MTIKKPKVSWLISTYNNESQIERCLNSVLNQTLKDFEIIIVNDGSDDNTPQILEEIYLRNKSFIKVLENDKNMGLAYSLNKAYKHARGIYLARLDADDIAIENRLEEQLKIIESNPKISIVGTRAFFINNLGDIIGESEMKIYEKSLIKPKSFIYALNIIHPSVLMRKEFLFNIGLYDNTLRRAQDLDLWLRATNQNYEFFIIDKPLIFYKKTNYKFKKSLIIFFYSLFITYKNKCFLKLFFWNLISLCLNIFKN